MKKKRLLSVLTLTALLPVAAVADVWQDPETKVNYEYTVGVVEAKVCSGSFWVETAGSPDATGDIAIKTKFTVDGTDYTVTSIGMYAFCDCTGLTAVTIPESVTYIGESAFEGCTSLANVSIPSTITGIGTDAFKDTPWWNSLPDGLWYSKNILMGYKGEKPTGDIVIAEGTVRINSGAFYQCSNLTSVTIPSSVTSIGSYAFYGCDALTDVYISDLGVWCSIDFADSYANPLRPAKHFYLNGEEVAGVSEGVSGNIVIPDGVTSIGNYAFYYCPGLKSVTIPSSLTRIGDYAFFGCTRLTSLPIQEGVTSIGEGAFAECESSGLNSLTIPSTVTSIGDGAFAGCYFIWQINVASGNTVYDSRDNCKAIIETATNTLIFGCSGTTIPESVTSIGNRAFDHSKLLKSVTIPESVTSIGSRAFSTCYGLTSVTIPKSVTTIGDGAFYDCLALSSVTICEGVTSIDQLAFFNCSQLKSVTIPSTVTSIGSSAFYLCYNLNAVHVSDLKAWCGISFGDYANPLESAHHLYLNGEEVKDLLIPEEVTSIGEYAFNGCTGLTSVTIPKNVTSIGKSAFMGCKGLTSVTSYISEPFKIGISVFSMSDWDNDYPSATLYVPKGTKAKYEETDGWNKFESIKEIGEGDQPKGDVNGDLTVDVADIASVISVMADGTNDAAADVNEDGVVDVADIATIISEMAARARQQEIED